MIFRCDVNGTMPTKRLRVNMIVKKNANLCINTMTKHVSNNWAIWIFIQKVNHCNWSKSRWRFQQLTNMWRLISDNPLQTAFKCYSMTKRKKRKEQRVNTISASPPFCGIFTHRSNVLRAFQLPLFKFATHRLIPAHDLPLVLILHICLHAIPLIDLYAVNIWYIIVRIMEQIGTSAPIES